MTRQFIQRCPRLPHSSATARASPGPRVAVVNAQDMPTRTAATSCWSTSSAVNEVTCVVVGFRPVVLLRGSPWRSGVAREGGEGMEPRPPRRVTPDTCVPAAWGWSRAPVKVGAEEAPQCAHDGGLDHRRQPGHGARAGMAGHEPRAAPFQGPLTAYRNAV